MPLNRFSNPIGLSWDKDLFYAKDESFSKVNYFTYLSDLPDNNFGIHSEQHGYMDGGASGVTWFADLRGHYTYDQTTGLFGYGFISLVPRTAHGQSQLFAHYVHAKLSIGITMAVPSFSSFSVSGGSLNDEMGT